MDSHSARSAVADHTGQTPDHYLARRAPQRSAHDGAWYVQETNLSDQVADDRVWLVVPDGTVLRAIPVGHPIHPPTPMP